MASEKHSLSSEVEISFQSKLPGVGTTIFTVMSALAAKHNAINLGQGFPDIPGYEGLFKLVYEKMQGGKNQYAPMQGIPELRQAISEKINALYHHDYDPSQEIVITAGGTQALFTAITAFIHPGDEVIVFDPVYDCYEPAVELCGGKTIHIPMAPPDFRPDFDRIKAALSPKTKMVILNSPNNPAGSVWRKEDMQQLENLLMGTGIIVLSDEVYEHLVFHPEGHQSVARYPGLAQRSFLVASFGKTYHNTGWKIGYIAGPEKLMNEFKKVHQFNVFAVNAPVQYALADFIREKSHYLTLASQMQEKRDYFLQLIKNSRWKFTPAEGTYFQLLDYSGISDQNDREFSEYLVKEKGLAAIPVSVFYQHPGNEKLLRFCFAKKNETLEAAANILNAL